MYKTLLKLSVLALAFILQTLDASATHLSIVASIPPATPTGSRICITGGHPALSNWEGAGINMKEIGPNLYVFETEIPESTILEFKFTRGDFASVEKTSQGVERPNRKLIVKGEKMLERVAIEAWSDQLSGVAAPAQPEITGNYRFLRQLRSSFLARARDVVVWLPPSYAKLEHAKTRYPVIYMHDGGNLFDPGTSFGAVDWGIDEVMYEGM